MKGNDLGCPLGCEELKGNVWLYGDVYYPENAIKTILNGTTNYYGRAKGNALKKYGEFWAFKSDDILLALAEISLQSILGQKN